MKYNILHNGKAKEVGHAAFIEHCMAFLKDRGFEESDWRVAAALAVCEGGTSPWELEDGRIAEPSEADRAFYEAVCCCYQASLQITNPVVEIPEQVELTHALETIEEIRDAEMEEQEKLLQQIVDKNFEVMPNGAGLKLKEGASLNKEDGYVCVGALTEQIGITDDVKSKCNLALADVLTVFEKHHGDGFEASQVMEETGRSYSTIKHARMVGRMFPADLRQELDPSGFLAYSHFGAVSAKELSQDDKNGLIRFAAKRSASLNPVASTKLQKLAKELAKVPAEFRASSLEQMDTAGLSTEDSIDALRLTAVKEGVVPDARKRWLYIFEGDHEIWTKTSNELCREMAATAIQVIRLTDMTERVGPDTFDPIEFVYVSPEVKEPDPVNVVDDAYADYRIFFDPEYTDDDMPEGTKGSWRAVGTKGGHIDKWVLEGSTYEECLQDLCAELKVVDGKDTQGRGFHFRS